MKVNALDLFLNQKRFDLIFKYLYLKNKDININFFENLYLEHIRAFNNFYEIEPSDGNKKTTKEDFIVSFNKLHEDIKSNGFDLTKGFIPIGNNKEISDGAHRLSCAALLGLNVEVQCDGRNDFYDYRYFKKKGINLFYADYAALEYVKLNPKAYIVNLHSAADMLKDKDAEKILEKYGFIFYQKNIHLNFNGYVNIKKLSYGSFWEKEPWIGTVANNFKGAQAHAKSSMGNNPLRAYVFVCDDLNKVIQAKAEIRALYNIGNFSIHVNDTREEAIWLAETYFNDNSLQMINSRPFSYENPKFDDMVAELKEIVKKKEVNIDDVCGAGSTPFDVYGLRKSSDLDFLYFGDNFFDIQTETLSNHDSELRYYPYCKEEIIKNPKYHFYYHGIKFITMDVLYRMKEKRHEIPKDIDDCKMIRAFQKGKVWKPGKTFKIFQKIKNGNERKLILFGFIKITYRKRKK